MRLRERRTSGADRRPPNRDFFFERPLLTATDIATSIFFILVVCPD
jgi:hypothetical protein